MKRFSRLVTVSVAVLAWGTRSFADEHTTGVPLLSSRPGAAYTVFLDPSGFSFNGEWGGSGKTPGTSPSLNGVPSNGAFGAADIAEINAIYAAMANQYRSFDVNVTTIDPASGANAATDAARQAYYDSQARMMHTIIGVGGTPGWHTGADGLALLGTIDHVATSSGEHTNFMFTEAQDGNPTLANGNYIGSIASHENGHTFGLHHQSDYTGGFVGGTLVNEYTNGDDASGNGNYVATMGAASDRQRVAWRVGSSNGGEATDNGGGTAVENFQNDVKTILANNGMSLRDSGIGHTFATATPIPLAGTAIDLSSPLHRGIISPNNAANPNPIGVSNYTQDVFTFNSDGSHPITLTCNDGNDLLVAGVADNGATLRSTLSIFSSSDPLVPVAVATEDASTLLESYSGLLSAGSYYAEIASYGGHNEVTASYNAAQYYDMGGYFLTGSGFAAVPEPTCVAFLAFGAIGFLRRRRHAVSQ